MQNLGLLIYCLFHYTMGGSDCIPLNVSMS